MRCGRGNEEVVFCLIGILNYAVKVKPFYSFRCDSDITGDFYANTYKCSPFNEPRDRDCLSFEKESGNKFGEIITDSEAYAEFVE